METKTLIEKLSQKRLFKKGELYSTRTISQRIKPTKREIRAGFLRTALKNHPDWCHHEDRTYKYLGSMESPVSDQMQLPLEETQNVKDEWQDKVLNQVKQIVQYLEESEDISKNSYIAIRRKLATILHILNIK